MRFNCRDYDHMPAQPVIRPSLLRLSPKATPQLELRNRWKVQRRLPPSVPVLKTLNGNLKKPRNPMMPPAPYNHRLLSVFSLASQTFLALADSAFRRSDVLLPLAKLPPVEPLLLCRGTKKEDARTSLEKWRPQGFQVGTNFWAG